MRYAKQYSPCLFKRDLSILHGLGESKRNHILCALSNLSKFLGCYEEFRALVKSYGLKWKSVKPELLMLSRIVRVEENGLILEWAESVKRRVPSLSLFLDFCFLTGLRAKEAIASWNMVRLLGEKNQLSIYFNPNTSCLEHFRFPEIFFRRCKKAFISFLPGDNCISEIIREGERVSWPLIHNRISKKGLPLRFGDIREFWANYMLKWLTPAEIDFLQGRVSGSIFMRHYFNPALIYDLRERVFKGLNEIQADLNG